MKTLFSKNRKFTRMIVNILSIFVIATLAFPAIAPADAMESCNDPLGCVTIGPSDPIHIAYALAMSGSASSLGIDSHNGIQIAIDDSGGEILGHNIQFDGVDEACTQEGGATAGTKLAADPSIVAVIGTSCSVAAREAMPLLSNAGLVMVSPSNTGPDLTEPGNSNNYPGYLRVSWNDRDQGARAARFAREHLGISTAATINDGSLYSGYLLQAFADEFINLGGTITAQETIDPGQTNMSTELTNIAMGSPEMLYFPIFMPEGGFVINQARETAGLEYAYLMGSDALWTEDVVTAAGENIEGFMVTGFDSTKNSPAYTDDFLPAYKEKFGTDPISMFHAHAYDSFMMIKAAIEQVAVVEDGTIQIGRQALQDALYGTANFPGLTGSLTCSATGDCADPHIAVYRYHPGQFPPEYFWPRYPMPFWWDDFDQKLLGQWYWVNENQEKWSLDENLGFLHIYAAANGTGSENLLLRPVAEGDFMIKTRLLFEPNTNYQFAGLVIWQDQENFLQFGRAFCDVEDTCVGNGIYFDKILGGGFADGNFATQFDNPFNPSESYLRLERRGDMVRAFYSHEGITWTEIGTHWIPEDFQVNAVGLTASQDQSGSNIPADFDFFELTEGWGFLPEGFHDYDSGDFPSWACDAGIGVGGWAADPDDRETDLAIEVNVDGTSLPEWLYAGAYREDLDQAGVCVDGNCSFSTSLPGPLSLYEPHSVVVYAQDIPSGEWVTLSNSPKTFTCRTYDIYTFDPATGGTKQVTNLPDTHEFNPRWSPDNKKIVHDTWNTDWSSHGVYITDVKKRVSSLLSGAEGGSYPTWSPSGKWIAFDRGADNDYRLFIIPPTGGTPRLVTEDAFMAAWAPNSKRLAFHRPSDGAIWTTDLNGGNQTKVAERGNGPAWSPDGEWIAFELDGDVWKVRVNNNGNALGDPIRLTSSPAWEGRPTWSNNSKTIAFHAGMGQDTDIWTIPAAGGTATWLTGAPVFGDYDPNYSFNGGYISYASFSPHGQAARSWVAAYTYDLPSGYWSEGTHDYHFEAEWEGGSEITPETPFKVSRGVQPYDGYALLRPYAVRIGADCRDVGTIHPDQRTRFLSGYVTDNPVTYSGALAYFDTLRATAIWDGGQSADLARHDILPFNEGDWFNYVCTFTEAPPKMDLRVNYGHDWVESFYEAGHQVAITVTDSEGNPKATAEVVTETKDFWGGQTGFQTTPENWSPAPPDLQPYDWVYAQVDNGATAQVQLGDIQGEVNFMTDSIMGTLDAPWITDPVQVECLDWGSGQQPPFDNKDGGFHLTNASDPYSCSWEGEWDVQPWQDIGVGYSTPDGHWVANAFRDERWMAVWTYDPLAGSLQEGEHSYYYDLAYTVPEYVDYPPMDPRTFSVSEDTLLYDGYALLGPWDYMPVRVWNGTACEVVSTLNPDQPIRFISGWVNDYSMTYEEALAHFNSLTVDLSWDGEAIDPASFTMTGLLPFRGQDARIEYICMFTGDLVLDASQPDWVNSGITVSAGQSFTIEAFGRMNPCSDTYPNGAEICIFYTPAGGEWEVPYENMFGVFPGPGLRFMALLGRIGDGKPFYVGAGDTFTAEQAGTLWFTPNDNLRTDNQGAYSVLVELEP